MKVGHRQVVTMIRQGGNHLVLKVVTVTRTLDPDDTARKKGLPCPGRVRRAGGHCTAGVAVGMALDGKRLEKTLF